MVLLEVVRNSEFQIYFETKADMICGELEVGETSRLLVWDQQERAATY